MSLIYELRRPKVAGMAVFDWVATGLAAAALAGAIRRRGSAPAPPIGPIFVLVFAIMIVAAIGTHVALGVPTQLNVYLGLASQADVDAARRAAAPMI